jgi:broad specificity phosphatase PhoE
MKLMVIRHSDREIVKDSESAHLAQLTNKGIEKAINFGKQLNGKFDIKLDNIFTSYVERCVDTGKLIEDSHKLDVFPEGKISFYIPENEENLATWGYIKLSEKIEVLDYLAAMFEKREWDYPKMFEELSKRDLLNHESYSRFSYDFISKFYFPLHNNLVVTHDIIITPLMHYFSDVFKFKMEKYMFEPNPLSGFCLYRENKREVLEWINFENNEIQLKRLI